SVTDARGAGASRPVLGSPQQKDFQQGALVWLGYELASTLIEAVSFDASAIGFPQVDGRHQQTEVLSYLANLSHGARKVLRVCDAQSPPDRALKRFAAETKAHRGNARVMRCNNDGE